MFSERYLHAKSKIFSTLVYPMITSAPPTQGELSHLCWELHKEFSSSKLEYTKLKDEERSREIVFFQVKAKAFEKAIQACKEYNLKHDDMSKIFQELYCDFSKSYDIMS